MLYYECGFDIILFLMRFYDNTIQNGGKMKNDIIIGREEGSDSFLKNKNNVLFLICLALLILIPITVYASSKYSQEAEAASKAYTSSLYISEYMTANTHYFDESGKSSDFIEIHNGSKEIVNLRGYVLAKDDKTYMFPAQFPIYIPSLFPVIKIKHLIAFTFCYCLNISLIAIYGAGKYITVYEFLFSLSCFIAGPAVGIA